MLRTVLESQAPPKFTATETINTLSNRLANATLLEDRRGAILGLRSFAKEYPATVASGALRHLITTLSNGVDDVDTGKVILETLLMLFNPNEESPEASPDITLWLADEFTTRQDNITILLDLLEQTDFYSRLYALQLMAAISIPRPERTQECILAAPLGITKLVSTLDDAREAIRNAGLVLLNEITQGSPELQKVVAFENAFERIFNLIKAEGSLSEGGIVVQDCLTLLANLLSLNASNQSLFRETGFVTRIAQLLAEDAKAEDDTEKIALDESRDKNMWGLLAILRMFLIRGNLGTQANQNAFEKNGVLQLILDLAFNETVGPPIRAEALKTCADIIKGNSKIQERFAHNKVPKSGTEKQVNGAHNSNVNGDNKTYIIDALLDSTLSLSSVSLFDVRFASSQCIQAYFYNHMPIRQHFLRRAIEGHTSGEDETSNIITILIHGPRTFSSPDPYRLWFAAELVHQLLFDSSEAKSMTMAIKEGDASEGEEVVTCIQTLAGNLTTAIQSAGEDDRVCIGYLMVLCTWLFEDSDAVNDLLSEGSVIQSLIQTTSKNEKGRELVQGLCAVILGIIYEFSTKDSPVSRRTLQPLLIQGLGREIYVSRITRLREHPSVRDYEVLPQDLSSAEPGLLPDVFFDQTFVNLLKDNFTRLIRAIDKDPGIEVSLSQEGIDRDLVDSLQAQIKDKDDAIQKADSDLLNLQGKLGQEQADHRRSQEKFNTELLRIKNINEALQKSHETESENTETKHQAEIRDFQEQHRRDIKELEDRVERIRKDAEREAEKVQERNQSELSSLQKHIEELEQMGRQSNETIEVLQRTNNTVSETVKQRDSQLESMKQSQQVLEEKIEFQTTSMRNFEAQVKDLEKKVKEAGKYETQLQVELNKKEEARQSAQTELDDLLILLGDLEEKRTRDKKKLRELGAEVSDVEEDEEGDEEGEDESGEDEGEDESDGEDGEDEGENELDEEDKEDGENEGDEEDKEEDGEDASDSGTAFQDDQKHSTHMRDESID